MLIGLLLHCGDISLYCHSGKTTDQTCHFVASPSIYYFAYKRNKVAQKNAISHSFFTSGLKFL